MGQFSLELRSVGQFSLEVTNFLPRATLGPMPMLPKDLLYMDLLLTLQLVQFSCISSDGRA